MGRSNSSEMVADNFTLHWRQTFAFIRGINYFNQDMRFHLSYDMRFGFLKTYFTVYGPQREINTFNAYFEHYFSDYPEVD